MCRRQIDFPEVVSDKSPDITRPLVPERKNMVTPTLPTVDMIEDVQDVQPSETPSPSIPVITELPAVRRGTRERIPMKLFEAKLRGKTHDG